MIVFNSLKVFQVGLGAKYLPYSFSLFSDLVFVSMKLDKVEISIELGAFMECDLGTISKWQNSTGDKRFLMGCRFPVSDSTCAEWLKQIMLPLPKHPSIIYWAIRAKIEQTLLGNADLFDLEYQVELQKSVFI